MVQPKESPVSLRIGGDLLARVDAYAQQGGWSRNGALLDLIREGLGEPAPEKSSGPPPKKSEVSGGGVQIGPTPPPYGSRLKKR